MLKDRETMGPTAASPCSSAEAAVCDGCGGRITDRYYLVTVDRQWHSACLKCCECKLALDSQVSCFVKDGNIYCKEDFYRYGYFTRQMSSVTSPDNIPPRADGWGGVVC